ncbi:MAG TPA: hypothetical protein VIM30_16305 [Candidatus Limnocylindrales bacterium]|jgi:hypothetical protein
MTSATAAFFWVGVPHPGVEGGGGHRAETVAGEAVKERADETAPAEHLGRRTHEQQVHTLAG